MPRGSLILFLILASLLLGAVPSRDDPAIATLPLSGLRVLRSDEHSVTLELDTREFALSPEHLTAGPFEHLIVPGYDLTRQAGQPQVPAMNTLLGAPPDARIELRILTDEATPLPARYRLPPAPHPAPLTDDLQPGKLVFEPDEAVYASDTLYPPAPARIAGDAWLRDQRLVRVELYPFQYNPAQGMLVWHRRLRVEVRFLEVEGEKGEKGKREKGKKGEREKGEKEKRGKRGKGKRERERERERESVQDSPFEFVLRGMLLNYEEAGVWRRRLPQHAPRKTQDVRRKTQYPIPNTQYPIPNTQYPIPDTQSSTTPRYKITVDHDSLYRISYEDLRAAGMDLDTVDPRTFGMTSQGEDVAIYVAGEDDGRFDPGDAITFYGQKFRGDVLAERYANEMADWLTLCPKCELAGMFEKYTDENVYWLTAGDTPGPRMATLDGAPTDTAPVPGFYRATVHAEQSHEWYTHHFSSEDTWFWDRVQTGFDPISRTYTTTLTALAGGTFTATVRGEVVARNSGAHDTRFLLNNRSGPLDWSTWSGKTNHTFEVQVDQSDLNEGENELHFVSDGDLDWVYFNWFEIEYARRFEAEDDQLLFPGEEGGTWQYEIDGFTDADVQVFDVTSPLAPRRVKTSEVSETSEVYHLAFEATHDAGARFLVVAAPAVQSPKAITRYTPPDLRSPENGADYIIITHRKFYAAVQRLADYRAGQGMRVTVVDVDDLYNEFNDGIFHPIAVRNFLAYAYANWQPPAPSYVLLVGDGHWNFKGYGTERYGEPAPIYMPPNLAFVDPWQGEVDSTNLLAAIVGDDILPDLAIGRLPVNSVAELDAAIDKIIAYEQARPASWQRHTLFVADNVPDAAGDFVSSANDIIDNHLPASLLPDRIYLNDYGCPPGCTVVKTAIIDDLNRAGALLVNYIGHGSVDRWADEQVFVNGDIPSLVNGERLPVVLSMTCLDGYWLYPGRPSLAEEMVRADGHGAVSTFSPTGLGVATGHHVLHRRFYDAVFQDGIRELGLAAVSAKVALYATGGDYDLIDTFTVFGDPALRIQMPPATVYLPLTAR